MTRKVFISYSRHDAARVAVLATDIESLGHEVWIDRALTGGQRWWEQILGNIRECDVFVVAISAAALDSRACLSEFGYACALGKPVLPVVVQGDFADSLMPPSLGDLQRVDYSAGDKVAFAALSRSLATLPEPGAPPDVPPPAPGVPASYLFDLKTEIGAAGAMSSATQEQLLKQLESSLSEGHAKPDVLSLVRRFRQRDDVLVRMDRSLAELEARLGEAAEAPARASSARAATATAPDASRASASVARLMATEMSRPPELPEAARAPEIRGLEVTAPKAPGRVHPAWWLAPLCFALLGGTVAWLANRDADPKTAKHLFIAGVIMTFVQLALLNGA